MGWLTGLASNYGELETEDPTMEMQADDPVGKHILKPTFEKRARILDIASDVPGIGGGIQPVSRYPGGAQMAGARTGEMMRGQQIYADKKASGLSKKLRNVAGLGNTVKHGVGLVKDIVVAASGAGGGGAAGMAGTSGWAGVGTNVAAGQMGGGNKGGGGWMSMLGGAGGGGGGQTNSMGFLSQYFSGMGG